MLRVVRVRRMGAFEVGGFAVFVGGRGEEHVHGLWGLFVLWRGMAWAISVLRLSHCSFLVCFGVFGWGPKLVP